MGEEVEEIVEFWFSEPMNSHWFRATAAIDDDIRDRYEALWKKGAAGELSGWRETAAGCLALVILLDQFPLNMYRGRPEAFATEAQSIEVSLHAIARGFDRQLSGDRLAFLYMPLMHSEDPADQERSVELYESAGLQSNARFARHHRELIRRFGRFPHRNAILGRRSTAEELEYLASQEAFTG